MKKMLVSALLLTGVITTSITGYAASSKGGQLTRPCASWCQDMIQKGLAGTSVSDMAAFAGKRVLTYKKASAMEKKDFITGTADKNNAASSQTDTTAKADTVSVQTDAFSVQTVAVSAENTAASTVADTTVAANQALCPHGYCIGQGLCPYSDCPNGGYCVNNDGYQYQENWNNGAYMNGGGDSYADGSDYGGQSSDYTSYQGGQGYGYQGGCGQGYGQGNGHGHHHGGHH